MKCFKVALGIMFAVSVAAYAAPNTVNNLTANTDKPLYGNSGVTTATTAGSAAVGTIAANPKRIFGYIQNVSNVAIKLSLTATTTAAIAANYVILKPFGDAAGNDVYPLANNRTVYVGGAYFMGVDSMTYNTNSAATVVINEWNQ